MIDYSVSGLQQKMVFELLDRSRRSINALDGVDAFSRERNLNSTPRSAASIDVTPRQPLNLLTAVIRPWVEVSFRGEVERHPLFTGIPQFTGESRAPAGAKFGLKMADFSTLLDVPLRHHYAVAPGDLVTAKLRALLEQRGIYDAAITESSATVSSGMFWAATETYRKVINTLLGAIGYSSVWADEWGQLRLEPYVDRASRPVNPDLGFVHGSTCTYEPEFTMDHDIAGAVNHVVITARMPWDTEEPVVAEAYLDPAHPYSIESRGGLEVPYTESDVDLSASTGTPPENPDAATVAQYRATLQTSADAYARRKLEERANPSRQFTVSNRWRIFDIGDATRFYAPARGSSAEIDTRVTVVKDSVRYTAGMDLEMTTTLEEVFQ